MTESPKAVTLKHVKTRFGQDKTVRVDLNHKSKIVCCVCECCVFHIPVL